MECKRDSFSGALGGARETHREYVSHRLNEYTLEIHRKNLFIHFGHFLYMKMVVKHKSSKSS